MIKDRGNIKWQSAMMLPEYAKLLSEARVNYEKAEKPVIDEQTLHEIEISIHEAMEYNLLTEYHYFQDGSIHSVRGFVYFIDYHERHYRINDLKQQKIIIPFDVLTSVNVLNDCIQLEEE